MAGIALLSASCADTTNTTGTNNSAKNKLVCSIDGSSDNSAEDKLGHRTNISTDSSAENNSADNKLGSIKNISTTQTTSTSFTVQYTLPTPSEITQAARDDGAANPVYTRSHVSVRYREINTNKDTESYQIFNDIGYLVATDNEQARLYTIKRSKTNTLYHYVFSVSHHFEVNNYHSKPIRIIGKQFHEARTLVGTVPAIIKNISTTQTTRTTFTVQYTLPTLSEITQEARDDRVTNPAYTNSNIYIGYREATDTEPIPNSNVFENENKEGDTVSDNATASNNEQTQFYTVAGLKPNTRYFYELRTHHRFEKEHPHYSDFSTHDEKVYEARTLP